MQHTDIRQQLRELFLQTKSTLATERSAMLDAVRLIGELHACNPWVNLGLNESEFMTKLGITRDCYYSRVRAARALRDFPEMNTAFLSGEVSLSTIGMIESKLTRDNIAVVLENVSGKTKREAKLFLSKVQSNGEILDRPGTVEITMTVSEHELAAFTRLREVLSSRGKNPSTAEVLVQAVEDSLEKRDPVRKAERALARNQKKQEQIKTQDDVVVAPVQQVLRPQHAAISAQVRYQVWLRDQGQCNHHFADGRRCEERGHLELDHIQMRCRGGSHESSNLRLVCRRHNQMYAEIALGVDFMRDKRVRGNAMI